MNTIEDKKIQGKKELPKSPVNQSEEELKEERTDGLVNKIQKITQKKYQLLA